MASLVRDFFSKSQRPEAGFVAPSGWLPLFPAPLAGACPFNKAKLFILGMKTQMGCAPRPMGAPLPLCPAPSYSAHPSPLFLDTQWQKMRRWGGGGGGGSQVPSSRLKPPCPVQQKSSPCMPLSPLQCPFHNKCARGLQVRLPLGKAEGPTIAWAEGASHTSRLAPQN